jgi:hypothetical protein
MCFFHSQPVFPAVLCTVRPQAASILSAAPALVAMQPQTLAMKVTSLQQLAATHPRWQAAVANSSAKSLAVMLTYSLQRQQRLKYLVDHGMQDRWAVVDERLSRLLEPISR